MSANLMFLAGLLSLAQVLVLPGLIVQRCLRLPDSLILKAAYLFALSLTVNYLLGFALTAVGLFTRSVALFLVALEVILLAVLYLKPLSRIDLGAFSERLADRLVVGWKGLFGGAETSISAPLTRLLTLAAVGGLFVLAVTSLEWASRYIRYNAGDVFNTWDTILSWNRWAVEWASNRIPIDTEDYAQLIPINWAWMFLIVGSPHMQLFAQGLMPVFTFAMLLALFGYAVYRRQPGYLAAVFVLRVLIKKFQDNFITAGYVDLPLAFMGLMAILALHEAWCAHEARDRQHRLMLAIILGSGAAATKQPGLLILAVVLAGALWLWWRLRNRPAADRVLLPGLFLPPAIIALPWYAFSFSKFFRGQADTHLYVPLQQSMGAEGETTSVVAKVQYGLSTLGSYQYLFLALIPALLLLERFWQVLTAAFILPYTLLWAGYANYDFRNLVMIFPLAAIPAGLALWRLAEIVIGALERLKLPRLPVLALIVFLLAGLVLAGLTVSDAALVEKQEAGQTQIFSAQLNGYLQDNLRGQSGLRILSNYPVSSQPGFEESYVKFWFDDLEHMQSIIREQGITHILVPAVTDVAIREYLDAEIYSGRYQLLFENSDFMPYQLLSVQR